MPDGAEQFVMMFFIIVIGFVAIPIISLLITYFITGSFLISIIICFISILVEWYLWKRYR